MKVNLIISPYREKNDARRAELEYCFHKNMQAGFDYVICVTEIQDTEYIRALSKPYTNVKIELCGRRATFGDFFYYANTKADGETISCICNSDIFIDKDNLDRIKALPWSTKPCLALALARWDVIDLNDLSKSELFNRPDAQDFWCYKDINLVSLTSNADIRLGEPGSDNCIAHILKVAGYEVYNPSKTIRTYHYHHVVLRNYYNANGEVTFRYQPPYHLIHPHTIADIK